MMPFIDFEPVGRRAPCTSGETILEVAQRAGIMLNATCGGEGICGHCVVHVMAGTVSPPNQTEEIDLGLNRVNDHWRLACQTKILGDLRIHIPPESLATAQRTQTEGRNISTELNPAVRCLNINLPPPNISDQRSDASRLREALALARPHIPLSVLQTLPKELRTNDFHVSVFLRDSTVVAIRPSGTSALGFAVDLGTTKLAGYLVDLTNGETLASAGAMNPQIAFGEDVMARISHSMSKPEGGEQLRTVIVAALNAMAGDLCAKINRSPSDIADAVVVGNTAMHHLFLGLPVRQLGLAPYVPAESAALDIPADEIGCDLAPGANVHLLPNIAGFVGADHVAMILGSGMLDHEGIVLGMDIGTNTEISLIANGKHYACSTASGPAFEGAHIRHGMRAGPGAIEKVLIRDGQILLQTIDNQPAVGLCGSGILDLVAQMHKAGMINSRGALDDSGNNPRVRPGSRGAEFIVISAEENHGAEITFSRSDINEIQLAKGAMRTGVNLLLQKAGVQEQEIEAVFIAGAFGTYLDVQSGIDIGMFPRLEKERFVQVGNAAGTGARLALLSTEKRKQAVSVAHRVIYVELTTEKNFPALFAKSLMLGQV
ncbi:MAG: ASKHA domain-containing protein [Anaerolineales bacterium]|jgi:uncharacterized 2Fe-2S/4Fe-4S cluster protein (DUF4445 family)